MVRQRIKADLGWLHGYPVERGQRWIVVPPIGVDRDIKKITLTGEHVAKATRAARKLCREHRAAMRQIVGDTDAWLARTLALLDALKPALHKRGKASLDALHEQIHKPRQLRSHREAAAYSGPGRATVRKLARMLGWMFARDGAQLVQAMAWVVAHAGELQAVRDDDALLVRLCLLGLCDGKRAEGVMAALSADGLYDVPLRRVATPRNVIARRRRGEEVEWPARPRATLGNELEELVVWACRQRDQPRRRTLLLIELLLVEPSLSSWRQWWQTYDALVAQGERLLAHLPLTPHQSRGTSEVIKGFHRLDATAPTGIYVTQALTGFRPLAAVDAGIWRALLGLLRAVPHSMKGYPLRLSLFQLFWGSWLYPERVKRMSEWARLLSKHIAKSAAVQHGVAHLKRYWSHGFIPSGHHHWLPDQDLLDPDVPAAAVARFYGALGSSFDRLGAGKAAKLWTDAGRVAMLSHLARMSLAPDVAAELVVAATQDSQFTGRRYLSAGMVHAAASLAEGDARRFASLMTKLNRAGAPAIGYDDEDDQLGLKRSYAEAGACQFFGDMILRGETRRLIELGGRVRVLAVLKGPHVPLGLGAERRAAWMRRYPKSFGKALRALAAYDDRAERSAAQILGKSFPDPKKLETELSAIEARLAEESNARLAKRAANLRKRLSEDKAISDKRARSLLAKLEAITQLRVLDHWKRRLEQALSEILAPRLYGDDALPPWVLEAPCRDLLPHLLALETAPRQLSFTLLRERDGKYPWDLRDNASNASFIAAMKRRGLDMDPWLDGIGVHPFDSSAGRIFLQLERDPIEVLGMGGHFDTCLAPGAFNFFSAVTNAADINKRVIYGRDRHGTVLGRTLICLSNDGTILMFHSYSHDARWGYAEHDKAFVRRLAEQMGSDVATEGDVKNLVANDWYDDGPQDVTGRFSQLHNDMSLVEKVASVHPRDLIATLSQALAPVGLNSVTLPPVLQMPALSQRPELFTPLLDFIARRRKRMPLNVAAIAAERAWAAAARDAVREFLHRAILPGYELRISRTRLPRVTLLVILAEIGEASLVLRLIRRSSHVRRWSEEPNVHRLWAGAVAHEDLHRRKLAIELFRRVHQLGNQTMKKRAAERLAQLGAPV